MSVMYRRQSRRLDLVSRSKRHTAFTGYMTKSKFQFPNSRQFPIIQIPNKIISKSMNFSKFRGICLDFSSFKYCLELDFWNLDFSTRSCQGKTNSLFPHKSNFASLPGRAGGLPLNYGKMQVVYPPDPCFGIMRQFLFQE